MGLLGPFFICGEAMALDELLESTLSGMGYELVEIDQLARGRFLRIFVDKPGGISIDDCSLISNHLSRLLLVENIDYDRLEVSSPGLDRLLRKEADFVRFKGELVKLKLRVAFHGQRNFVGILKELNDGVLTLEVDGKLLDLELSNLVKVRLVPKL